MMSEKIRKILINEHWTVVDLAKAWGTSSQNLYNKLKRDNFTEQDLREIAEILGVELEINFISKAGQCI